MGETYEEGKSVADISAYEDVDLEGTRLSRPACRVLRALEAAGLEAWVVGGWVRDALMHAPSHDVDMCCSAPWQHSKVALEAAGIDVVESGIKFGGITAIADGERIEVTTYRLDGFYTDGRHPEEVTRAERVEDDLARRDFTVNAMAWHPVRGLLDLYDGVGDLARREIRAVGEPRRRFEEDALRMLRAVRFACRLDFTVEPATRKALADCAPLLDAVARERVGVELQGVLATGLGGDALERYPEVMCAAIPELAPCRGFDQCSIYHDYDVYDHTRRVLTVACVLARAQDDGGAQTVAISPSLMWAALLHDIGKPQTFIKDEAGHGHFYGHPELGSTMAQKIMHRLALPNDLIRDACLLIKYHDRPLRADRKSLLKMMNRFAAEGVDTPRLMDELFDLKRADALGKSALCFEYVWEVEDMREVFHKLLEADEAYSVKTLAISGRDLIAMGVEPGRRIGELLEQALAATMQGGVANRRDDLLCYLAQVAGICTDAPTSSLHDSSIN